MVPLLPASGSSGFLGSALGLGAESQESWTISRPRARETQAQAMVDFEGSAW